MAFVIDLVALPFLFLLAALSRLKAKSFDVGIGPEPLINNVYHKLALQSQGYKAETFVQEVYYITDKFDVRADLKFRFLYMRMFYLFFHAIFSYRILYFYFNGGPLGNTALLWRMEPWLYCMAGIKTVVMPYGGDIQDMLRCPNLTFRAVIAKDYDGHRRKRPRIIRQIDLWTLHADHIIGGCDWVDYLYYWDTLMISHFCIDTHVWKPQEPHIENDLSHPLRILHAPNHRSVKGTSQFIRAVEELQKEGVAVELAVIEKMPNEQLREEMQRADIIADQLLIGWYAVFAIEGMALGKPVICYLRDDLIDLYVASGLLEENELPLVNASPANIKQVIKNLSMDRSKLKEMGRHSRAFVEKHHSIESLGKLFDGINKNLFGRN
jgi:glycosyltransferase involved in cell wall biosynthesis